MTNVTEPVVPRRLVLEPGRSGAQYWQDLWRYRELFVILAWRDIAVRYKQTVIGLSWALIRPFLTMVVFTFIFGKVAQLPTDGNTPYALMVFAGMLPWFLFSGIVSDASNSLILNSDLVGKVYFPRMIIPGATAVVALVDFLISFLILAGIMLWHGFLPDLRILALPIFVLLALATALGPALLLCALNVKYRDFRHTVPFLVQFGLYISPVGFSSAVVSDGWRWVFGLNPVVGVIDGFRWCLLAGESRFHWPSFAASVMAAGFLLWLGIRTFRRTEQSFADLI